MTDFNEKDLFKKLEEKMNRVDEILVRELMEKENIPYDEAKQKVKDLNL